MYCSLYIINILNVSKINQNVVYICEVLEQDFQFFVGFFVYIYNFIYFVMFCLVQEFVLIFIRQDIEYFFRNVLVMGRGSLDFVKKLLDEKNVLLLFFLSLGNNSFLEWCRCGVCRFMFSDQENFCCKRVNCIICFQVFNNICFDRDILEVCIKVRCDIRVDDFNFSMESFRKVVYR